MTLLDKIYELGIRGNRANWPQGGVPWTIDPRVPNMPPMHCGCADYMSVLVGIDFGVKGVCLWPWTHAYRKSRGRFSAWNRSSVCLREKALLFHPQIDHPFSLAQLRLFHHINELRLSRLLTFASKWIGHPNCSIFDVKTTGHSNDQIYDQGLEKHVVRRILKRVFPAPLENPPWNPALKPRAPRESEKNEKLNRTCKADSLGARGKPALKISERHVFQALDRKFGHYNI